MKKKLKKRYSMPSSFVLDRMLAIYFAIFERKDDTDLMIKPKRDCELYSQVCFSFLLIIYLFII